MTLKEAHKIITGAAAITVTVGGISAAVTGAIFWVEEIRENSANACIVDAKINILRAELNIVDLQTQYSIERSDTAIYKLELPGLTSGPDINMFTQAIRESEHKAAVLHSRIEEEKANINLVEENLRKCREQ